MDTSTQDPSNTAAQPASSFRPLPGHGLCARLGDKWTVQVLWHLSNAQGHRLRFSEIRKATTGITQRMLTLTLRNLERDGLVARHCFAEVPPRVEYSLTSMGTGLLPALESVNTWIRLYLPQIEQHRRDFDGTPQDTDAG